MDGYFIIMISEAQAKRYCKDDISLIENYDEAINDKKRKWACHHRGEILHCGVYSLEDLKKFGLYWKRPSGELIFMTLTEHIKLHRKHPLKNTREKMSKARIGKRHSEDTKMKMSKPIIQYTKEGKFIKEWIGTSEASRVLGIDRRNITRCCKGKLKSAGGFVWSYA